MEICTMSMTGEITLTPYESTTFDALAESLVDTPHEEASLAVDGLTSVMLRVQAEATDQTEQIEAGISDVNASMTAFQSN